MTIRATLTVKGYKPVLGWIRNAEPTPNRELPVNLIIWGIKHSARLVPNATCLTRSLAMRYLLAQANQDAQIQIGVKTDEGGEFKAHAWVLLDGEILTEDTAEEIATYKPLTAL